ncbi:IS1 family transposase [Xenorhabdus griffiniae]|uniref:IS1 family transposase n=1 Tax=Xenorhabdus griffiniae TaxID=351672 RepID=UPI003BAEF8D7
MRDRNYRTQCIKRINLTLLTCLKRLNRKTIGYSKSEKMHDKVIRTFIETAYYFLKAI